jgi:histone deacetylase 1/2
VVRFKARLVAQGCRQRPGVDYNETFAPVSSHSTRRVLLSLAAVQDLEIQQVDIKTAFLNGVLEEEVYVSQPPGFHNGNQGQVCKLLKSLYGLKQAPRAWHSKLAEKLKELGFDACKSDPALFVNRKNPESWIYLITYVDDLLIVSKLSQETDGVKLKLKTVFSVHDLGDVKSFLGSEVSRDRSLGTLKVTSSLKIENLMREYGILEADRNVETPMILGFLPTESSHNEQSGIGSGMPLSEGHRYLELIGSLQYLASTTRPDISQAVGVLSRYRVSPTTSHWNGAIRVLKYLGSTKDLGVVYGSHSEEELVGYVDSDFAGDLDTRKSTTGYLFLYHGAVISWCSKKQTSVATSTVEAEYIAASQAVKEAMWLGSLLGELGIKISSIKLYCDNLGCITNMKNHVVSKYTKHISVSYHHVREKVAWGQIIPLYVPSEENIADMFTKPLSAKVFQGHRARLGIS